MQPRWERYANDHFLHGIDVLNLHTTAFPACRRQPSPSSRYRLSGQAGQRYVPGFLFFDCLKRREFSDHNHDPPPPSPGSSPEPESSTTSPGMSPMHTERSFADTLVRFGDRRLTAANHG